MERKLKDKEKERMIISIIAPFYFMEYNWMQAFAISAQKHLNLRLRAFCTN
jgi:hypothetical protein